MKKILLGFVAIFMLSFVFAQPAKKTSTVKKTATSSSSITPLKAQVARGKPIYIANCLACHQADGSGVPRMNPPLIKTKWVLGEKKRLISVVLKGLNDPIEIEDEEYHNPMPPQPQLTDQQIADVLTFVRNSFGNKASAVTVGEVKGVRGK